MATWYNMQRGCQMTDKIGRFSLSIQSSNFIVQLENVLANFLDIGHHGDCLQWEMNIYFSYLFCLLLYDV